MAITTETKTTQRIPVGEQVQVWFRGSEYVGVGTVVNVSGTHNHDVRLDEISNPIDGRYEVGGVYGFEINRWPSGATLRVLNPSAVTTIEYTVEHDSENPF